MNKHLHFLSLLWLSMLMAFMTACSDDKNITDPAPEPEPSVEGQWATLTAAPDTWGRQVCCLTGIVCISSAYIARHGFFER